MSEYKWNAVQIYTLEQGLGLCPVKVPVNAHSGEVPTVETCTNGPDPVKLPRLLQWKYGRAFLREIHTAPVLLKLQEEISVNWSGQAFREDGDRPTD